MGDLLRVLDEQERINQKARGLVMQLFMEEADDRRFVGDAAGPGGATVPTAYSSPATFALPHATHTVVIPPGAFCCDVSVDDPGDDPPASHH
jgi:hypothetical protein